MAVISFERQRLGDLEQEDAQPQHSSDIAQLVQTTRSLRDEARALGLKHEAYLLHLAVLALVDRAKAQQ
ncbi:MAG: hypothetical protein AAGI06_06765 [Pseudomonadota bacterium]